jgi:hypothetical protein
MRMSAIQKLTKLAAIGCLCTVILRAGDTEGARGFNMNEGATVTMQVTHLDANDSSLTLSYSIRNETSHEVWVCDKIGPSVFEVFLTPDKQTLLIRKRLDLPSSTMWRGSIPVGRYVRIASGESLAKSVQISLPVSPRIQYTADYATESAQGVGRLALEIGYYNEDLPALIHSVIAVAKTSGLTSADVPVEILDTYFRGLRVRGVLGSFDQMNPDPYGKGYIDVLYSSQALTGEKVLRVDINDLSISYQGESR